MCVYECMREYSVDFSSMFDLSVFPPLTSESLTCICSSKLQIEAYNKQFEVKLKRNVGIPHRGSFYDTYTQV